MTKFRFRAATADGTVITGVESSTAIGDLRARLLDRNLQPISILEKKSILQVEITQKKVKKRELMHLCRQLAVFLRSGVSVLEALVILADETSNKVMKSALQGIRLSLESGARFSEAAAEHQELFPTYAIEILRSAELTGNLDQVLDQLADYLEREIDTSQRVRSAMAYPLVVMGLALVVSTVLVAYVLPKFRDFFSSLGAKLPLPTRILLAMAKWIADWGLVLGVVIVVLVITGLVGVAHPDRQGNTGPADPQDPRDRRPHPYGDRGALLPAPGVHDGRRRGATRGHRRHHRRHQQLGIP